MQRFGVEVRAELDGDTLRGHAAVFNQMAEVPGHLERIAPGAFDAALAADDVRALFNHDPNKVLGRTSAGTLRLAADDVGLAFEVDLPDTSYARDLAALVARGDVTGGSFGFIPGKDSWSRARDGRQLRTHASVKRLLDVSVVTYPAYDAAEVRLRHVDFDRPILRSQLIRIRHHALMGRHKP